MFHCDPYAQSPNEARGNACLAKVSTLTLRKLPLETSGFLPRAKCKMCEVLTFRCEMPLLSSVTTWEVLQ